MELFKSEKKSFMWLVIEIVKYVKKKKIYENYFCMIYFNVDFM